MTSEPEKTVVSEGLTEALLFEAKPSGSRATLDLHSLLEDLEKPDVPTINFPYQIEETVTQLAVTMCGDTVVMGLTNREVVSATFFPTPSLISFSPKEANHSSEIVCLSSSSDGKLCVSASFDTTLKVWSISECKELGTLKGHTDKVMWVEVAADNKQCVSYAVDEALKVWSLDTFEEIATDHIGEASILALTPDGKHCLCAISKEGLLLWSLEQKKTVAC